jgi:hypothetical protein
MPLFNCSVLVGVFERDSDCLDQKFVRKKQALPIDLAWD